MKLLIITENVGSSFRQGSEVFCSQLVGHLAKYHEVTLIAAQGFLETVKETITVDLSLASDPEALALFLAERVEVEEHDLVYNLGGLAYGAVVVTALAAQMEEDLPLVNHFQAMLGPYAQKEGLAEEMEQLNSADQKMLAEAAVLNIFLSHSDLEKSLASGFELSGAVNCVVPAAVHETDFAAVDPDASSLGGAARPDGQRPVVILTAGRFSDYAKGGDLVYRAFSYLAAERDDVFLLSITDSDRFSEVLAGVPAERYRIEPWLERPAFLRRLAGADMVVLPSRYEAFGLIALEAMMLELPVIANAVGGLQEIILHRCSGLLSECADGSYGLYLAMKELAHDPALRRRLGGEGLLRARREYNFERIGGLVGACLERARLGCSSLSRRALLHL
jgi:glycogen synthase